MKDHPATPSTWNERIRKETVKFGWWTALWVLSMAVSTFGPKFLWDERTGPTLLAIAANVAFGVGMIIANKRHIATLDEMQRKITFDAMALALGVTLVAGLAYSTLDATNVISWDAEIGHVVILMGLTYLAAFFIGQARYR